jgi:ParB family transcriptional regulator, chromosome partitioning protein
MSEPRKVLGRGISSLIPAYRPATQIQPERKPDEPVGVGLEVAISSIRLNPQQPRRRFSEGAIEELTQSIRRTGVLQPLVVRRTDTGFELIAGERRLRASKRAGLEKVPVVIRGSNDQDQLEVALTENLQRVDLNPIEEANGYDRLGKEFNLTQEEIAARVGKERSTVSNLLRLLKLPPAVQEMLGSGTISMGHARALLPIEDARRQEALAHKIEKEGLSVRQVENLVRSMLKPDASGERRATDHKATDPNLRHLSDELQRSLGTRVAVVAKGKGGEIRIQYYGSDDLRRLSDHLLRSR